MSQRITVKPAEGRLVRHPENYRQLAADGETVMRSSYWVRKLRAGDVVEVGPVVPADSINKTALPGPTKPEGKK